MSAQGTNQTEAAEVSSSGWGGTVDRFASWFSADSATTLVSTANSVSKFFTGFGYEEYTQAGPDAPTVYSERNRNRERFQALTGSDTLMAKVRSVTKEVSSEMTRKPLLATLADEYRGELKKTVLNQVRAALTSGEAPASAPLINELIDRVIKTFGPGVKRAPLTLLIQGKAFEIASNILDQHPNRLPEVIDQVLTDTPQILQLAAWESGGRDQFEITPKIQRFFRSYLIQQEAANASSMYSALSYVVPGVNAIPTVSATLTLPYGDALNPQIMEFLAEPENRQFLASELLVKPALQEVIEIALPNGSEDISIPHNFFRNIGYQLTEPTMAWVQESVYTYLSDSLPALITDKLFNAADERINIVPTSESATPLGATVETEMSRLSRLTEAPALASFIDRQVRDSVGGLLEEADQYLTPEAGTELRNKLGLKSRTALRHHAKAVMKLLMDLGIKGKSRIDFEGFASALTLNIVSNLYQHNHAHLVQILHEQLSAADIELLVAIAKKDRDYFTHASRVNIPAEVIQALADAGEENSLEGLWAYIHTENGQEALFASLTQDLWTSIAEELLQAALPEQGASLRIPPELLASFGITLTPHGKAELEAKIYDLLKSHLPAILISAVGPKLLEDMELPDAVKPFGSSISELLELIEPVDAHAVIQSTDEMIAERASETDRLMGGPQTSEYIELVSNYSVFKTKQVLSETAQTMEGVAGQALEAAAPIIDSVLDGVELNKLIQLNLLNITQNLGARLDDLPTYFLEELTINVMEDLAAYTEAFARISKTKHGLDRTRSEFYEALREDPEYGRDSERIKRIERALKKIKLTAEDRQRLANEPSLTEEALLQEKLQQNLIEHFCRKNGADLMQILLPSPDDLLIPDEFCAHLGVRVTAEGKQKIYDAIKEQYLPQGLAIAIMTTADPFTAKNTVYSSAEAMRGRNELIEMKEAGKENAEIQERAKVLIRRAIAKAESAIEEYRKREAKREAEQPQEDPAWVRARRMEARDNFGDAFADIAEGMAEMGPRELHRGFGSDDDDVFVEDPVDAWEDLADRFDEELSDLRERIDAMWERLEAIEDENLIEVNEYGSTDPFDHYHSLFLEVEQFEGKVRADIAERRWKDMDTDLQDRAKKAGVRLIDSVTTLLLSANDHKRLPSWLRWILVPIVGLARRFGYMDSTGEMVGEATLKSLSQRSLREWISFGLESGSAPLHPGEWDEFGRFLPKKEVVDVEKYPNFEVPQEGDAEREIEIRENTPGMVETALDEMTPAAPSTRVRQAYLAWREGRNHRIRRTLGERAYWLKRGFDACFDRGMGTSFGWVADIKKIAKETFYRKPVRCLAERVTWLVGQMMNEHLIAVAFDRVALDLSTRAAHINTSR